MMTAHFYVASSSAAPAILLGDTIGLVPLNGTGERVASRTVAGRTVVARRAIHRDTGASDDKLTKVIKLRPIVCNRSITYTSGI